MALTGNEKTTQSRPVGSLASLDSISMDGGVVLLIQLMIDAALSIELLGQYSIIDGGRESRGFASQMRRSFANELF